MNDDALTRLKTKTSASEERLQALLEIIDAYQQDYLPVFQAILNDPNEDPEVRSAVALSLGKISGRNAFEILQNHCQDPDPVVRNYVLQALGMTNEEAAAPLLIKALKDNNNTIFATASEALGDLGRKALPYLIGLLKDDAVDARCVAAWRLGELQDSVAVSALVQAVKEDAEVSVIALCIWALGEIGLGSQEVLEILAEAKQKPEPDVRLRAETAWTKIVRNSN